MKILFSIIVNASILFIITFLLKWNPDKWIEAWVIVTWWVSVYLLWGMILWLINSIVKPILKILSLPFFFLFFWLTVFIVNAIILKLFGYIINDVLIIDWMSYRIVWWINFVIAVAIFTVLNIIYSLLFFKK